MNNTPITHEPFNLEKHQITFPLPLGKHLPFCNYYLFFQGEEFLFAIQVLKEYRKIPIPYFKEWVEALESGNYKQGTGRLCQGEGGYKTYCCLGVLSEIQGRLNKNVFGFWSDRDGAALSSLATDNPNYSVLEGLGDFHGNVAVIRREFIEFPGYWGNALSNLNDMLKINFREIAAVIRFLYEEAGPNGNDSL